MALLTLATAKEHLRVKHDFHDADIQLKAEEASAIVLDYLKARTTAIASISVANPTVITTTVPHSLTSGVTYPIAGTTTTPTVNGNQVVTVTGQTTFTVPVSVTVGQAAAAGTVGAPIWTDDTVPLNVLAATLVVLEDVHGRRPINWEAVSALLMRFRDPALA